MDEFIRIEADETVQQLWRGDHRPSYDFQRGWPTSSRDATVCRAHYKWRGKERRAPFRGGRSGALGGSGWAFAGVLWNCSRRDSFCRTAANAIGAACCKDSVEFRCYAHTSGEACLRRSWVLRFHSLERCLSLQGACQTFSSQTLLFPSFMDAAGKTLCIKTGHCARSAQLVGRQLRQTETVSAAEGTVFDGIVLEQSLPEERLHAAAPPLFSRARISCPSRFR